MLMLMSHFTSFYLRRCRACGHWMCRLYSVQDKLVLIWTQNDSAIVFSYRTCVFSRRSIWRRGANEFMYIVSVVCVCDANSYIFDINLISNAPTSAPLFYWYNKRRWQYPINRPVWRLLFVRCEWVGTECTRIWYCFCVWRFLFFTRPRIYCPKWWQKVMSRWGIFSLRFSKFDFLPRIVL